jgi:acetoin utilization deacetylase AcuC-like enzyme
MDREAFFAHLDKLTPKEIEARLPSWDKEKLVLVQDYLEQKRANKAQSAEGARASTDAAWAATEAAMQANTKATIAIIIAVGAMLAAVASTVVALLGLQLR